MKLNPAIELPDGFERKQHTKASEEYISVVFQYKNFVWSGWVPLEYRRTGVSIPNDNECVIRYLNNIYDEMNPINRSSWDRDQQTFWQEKTKAMVTKSFFDVLSAAGWCCIGCKLPNNPNWARRIQNLKEFGYTLATDTKMYCNICRKEQTHLILLPIKRGGCAGNGYETWSPKLRKRIIRLLGGHDLFDGSIHCLPDHKFPEIRWDGSTKSENPDTMTDTEIREKFQLLSNQRNQQKREVCRHCYQTGERGKVFGITFFYAGNEHWDSRYPTTGKHSENGCIGCPWYDLQAWRNAVQKKLSNK